jgi:hypothetical protein
VIHYHGLPITPDTCALRVLTAGHAFISYARPEQMGLAVAACQSFALDNGAYSAWRRGEPVRDWTGFYAFAAAGKRQPACDFAVIPDVVDGSEADNDALLTEWPLPRWFGAPVWHLHESFARLERLATDWPRVCLGSSGEYAIIGTDAWWRRMHQAMRVICDDGGAPATRLHGLRMLDPRIFSRFPFTSADSTNIGRNIGIDQKWTGPFIPPTKEGRAQTMRDRIESVNAQSAYSFQPQQSNIFGEWT